MIKGTEPLSATLTPIDITSEEYRLYTYPDGSTFQINEPEALYIFEGKSGWTQRVVDRLGVTHRPTPGWNAISFKPKPGQPAFVA